MRFSYIITGNHEDPTGNPLGYVPSTQASKWNPRTQRYEAWKEYVRTKFYDKYGEYFDPTEKPFNCKKGATSLHIRAWWKNKKHCDDTNLQKGIEDALWSQDNCVNEHYTITEVSEDKIGRLEITIVEHG